MGMRTIRWRNGQCPGRNGQWAERIAHAGSEAVRLVPFSSLPAAIILSSEGLPVSQHGACRCAEMRDASRYRGDIFLRLSRVRATPCGVRVRLGRSVRARRPRAELCFRRRPRGARGAAARAVRSSDIFRTLAAYGGRRCRIWSGEAADRSMVAEGG